MSKEFFVVVCWNTETKEFYVDWGTTDSRFFDGEVWCETTGQWEVADETTMENVVMALDGLVRSAGKVEIEGVK